MTQLANNWLLELIRFNKITNKIYFDILWLRS